MLTFPMILDAALKVTLLLAVAGLATALMQKQSAAARHAVWAFAVLAALAIPPMEGLLPSWRAELFELPAAKTVSQSKPIESAVVQSELPARTAIAEAPSAVNSNRSVEQKAANTPASFQSAPSGVVSAPQSSKVGTPAFALPKLTTPQILFVIWIVGFFAALAPLAIGIVRVKAFARRANRGLSALWRETLEQLPATALPSRAVTFMESAETAMPLACGIFSPVVIVPGNAERWPAWKRRNILVHELAHVQRFDCLTQALATVLCAIYWFNPLAWVAASRMRIERELACDDRVLAAGSQPVDYADHLLEVARSLRPAAGTAMAAIAMARPSNLSTRLIAVLDSTRSRRSMSRRGAGLLGAASLLFMLPLAAFKPWKSEIIAAVQTATHTPATIDSPFAPPTQASEMVDVPEDAMGITGSPMISNVSTGSLVPLSLEPKAAAAAALSSLAVPPSLAVCVDGKSSSTHINQDDDGIQKLTLKYSSGDDCTLEILANGKFTFADDLSDVATLASGSTMTIKETNRGLTRKLEISSVGGGIQRRFYVNGVQAPFGDSERRWLADILLAVERRTGFSAKTRVPRLWENGGVKAVLNEVEVMNSSYPKRVYLDALFDIGINFDGPTLTRIIRTIGGEFDSDYERRVILSRMPSQKFMDENSWNAFADAVARMGSDYEKRMVLVTAFEKRQPSPVVAAKLLNSVSSMGSSYEIGQVLKGAALSYASNPVSRPAYIAAVRKMSSDYELRQVLVSLIDQSATPGAIADLLEPAKTIQSDYERRQVVEAFAQRGHLSSEAITTLTALTGGMKSDYEKRTALTALISASPRMDSRGLSEVLNVARSIDSDYDLSTFLREVIAKYRWNTIPRDAFDRALQSISSDTDQNAVRAAMQRAETR
jgi:beta-lactamase regulating signal transducer with metallopeptidase domain